LVLSLGIGLNSALFSLVNVVLLRPLPGFQTERVAMLYENTETGGRNWVRIDTLREWRKQAQSFERLETGAFFEMNLTGDRPAEQINTAMVTPGYFSLYRVFPAYGRTFVEEEGRPGRGRVAILDYRFWLRRFGGDPKILGQALTLDRQPYTVIGVAAPDFRPLGANVQLYRPLAVDDSPVGAGWVVGRLRGSVTFQTAQTEMRVITDALRAANPAQFKNVEAEVVPILEPLVSNVRPLLLLLSGAAGVVLLLVCANVANLLLARGVDRQREFAICLALGARPSQLALQTVWEGLITSLAGGALGLLIVWRTVPLISWLRLDGIPRLDEFRLDSHVILFAFATSLLTGVLCSMWPARVIRQYSLAAMVIGNKSASRSRAALVVAEIALTCLLVWVGGLLWQTLRHTQGVDLGFDPHHVLTFSLLLPDSKEREGRKEAAFDAQLLDQLRRIPGVESAAATTELPIFGLSATMEMKIPGRPTPQPTDPRAEMRIVSPDYFATMRMSLRRGRDFTSRDRWGAPGVAIINEAAARQYFAGQDPVGQRLLIPQFEPGMGGAGPETAREIVGVTADVRQYSLREPFVPHLYLPLDQNAVRYSMFAIRTRGRPESLIETVRRVVAQLDRDLPPAEFSTMDERMAFLTSQARTVTTLFAVFASLTVLLAAFGIYSVVAFATRQRTREIGIRMAVGAKGRDVLSMVLRQVAIWTGLGLGAAALALVCCRRYLESYLFGVRTADSTTALAVFAGIVILAQAAAILPAWRASRLDPLTALRQD